TDHAVLKKKYESFLFVAPLTTTTHPFIIGNYECIHITSSMVNHNYSLGFEPDREVLNTIVNGNYGFSSSFVHDFAASVSIGLWYDPALRTGVTIDGKVIPVPQTGNKKRKLEEHLNTILVWKTGQVTQSGPETAMCRQAYLLFMKIITDHADMIRAQRK